MEHWICLACRSLNEDRSKRCYRCRARRPDDAPVAVATVRTETDEWASVRLLERPGIAAPPVREPSLVGALLFGGAAAFAATAAWVAFESGETHRPFTAAFLVGIVVAVATIFGARGRTSFAIVMVSGLLTIACVVVGEYLIISSLLMPPGSTGLYLASADEVWAVMEEVLPTAPLRPVLWLAAIVEGFAIPWGRLVGPAEGRR